MGTSLRKIDQQNQDESFCIGQNNMLDTTYKASRQGDIQPKNMKHWKNSNSDILELGKCFAYVFRIICVNNVVVRNQIVLGEHYALWHTGSTRREWEKSNISFQVNGHLLWQWVATDVYKVFPTKISVFRSSIDHHSCINVRIELLSFSNLIQN